MSKMILENKKDTTNAVLTFKKKLEQQNDTND